MISRFKIRHRVLMYATDAGFDDISVAPVVFGCNVASVLDGIMQDEFIRITAEEAQRLIVVIVKLVLREYDSFCVDNLALDGEQRLPIRLRKRLRR